MSCQHQTQKQQVFDHMEEHGYITTWIAFDEYDICRLSERIRELEDDGHLIHHLPFKRNGKRFVAYSLVAEGRKRAA